MFWVLKRTVSLRRFFMYPQHMFWLRNKKNNFQIRTLIWRPEIMASWHSIASFWASQSWKAEPDHLIMCTQAGLRLPCSTIRGQKFHSSARNNECNLERLSNSSQSTHPVGRYRTSALERITHGSQITWIHDIWSKTISSKRRLVDCDIWSIRRFANYDVSPTTTIGRKFVELRRNLVDN